MTRILVTGGAGFVGRALVQRLCEPDSGWPLEQLTVVDLDLHADALPQHPALRVISGSITDAAVREQALQGDPELVFHLAAITSGQAERDFDLGLDVNMHATMALLQALRAQGQRTGHVPRLVQTSSIGVYGLPLPAHIDDRTPLVPTLSYGAQKLAMEVLLADYSRRGWIDGRTPRLSGVVTRPAGPNGARSSFASDLIRDLAEGRHHDCPVDAEGTIWLISLPACIDALLHAARIEADKLPATRAWTLPTLRASIAEVVAALMRLHGPEVATRIRYAPDPSLIPQFARWPTIDTACARALGFVADPSLDVLMQRALAHLPGTLPKN